MGHKTFIIEDYKSVQEAHFSVLQQLAIVEPYIQEHLTELHKENHGHSVKWIMKEHKDHFVTWLMDKNIPHGDTIEEKTLKMLASGPSTQVTSQKAFDINGYTYHTEEKDKKSVAQNSGIRVEAIDPLGKTTTQYGIINDIWELDYGANLQILIFR